MYDEDDSLAGAGGYWVDMVSALHEDEVSLAADGVACQYARLSGVQEWTEWLAGECV